MTSYELVPFHDRQILTIKDAGRVYVPLKPLVISMGLNWEAQRQRIERDGVLGEGTCILQVPSAGGLQDMVCMPLERIPAFIATIPLGHIKSEEVRQAVILFKREAFDVLFAHFFGGRSASSIEHSDRTARRRELPGLLDRYEAELNPEKRRILYELIVRACEAEGIAPPNPDAIRPVNRIEEEAIRLLAKIEARIADGSLTNHHRREDRLAFSMRELSGIGAGVGRDLMAVLKQHPRFLANCPVNCRDGRNRHCWVFLAD